MSGFAVGAILGAFAYLRISFFAIILPVAILLLLAWQARATDNR
jgi:uncharacterized membrane protein YoaK (UPF0700 family)